MNKTLINILTAVIFLFVLFLIITLNTCSTANDLVMEPEGKSLEANKLIFGQTALSLPEGWSFHSPLPGDEGIVFRFANPQGTISGSFGYVGFDFSISPERLAEYYSNEILREYVKKKIEKTTINNTESYLISAVNKDRGLDLMLALIPEGNNVNIIELVSSQDVLLYDKETALRIFHSYRYMEPGTSVRARENGLAFYCYDGSWQWLSDYKDGFYLAGKEDNQTCIAGIWRPDFKDLNGFLAKYGAPDAPGFQAEFFINNDKIKAEGVSLPDPDGLIKAYYFLQDGPANYCVMICLPDNTAINADQYHTAEPVVKLFQQMLLFD